MHSPLELSVVYIRTYVYSPYLPAQSACMHPQSAVLNPLAIKVTFWPFQTLKQKMVHLKTLGYYTAFPVAKDHRLAEHQRALKNGDVSASAISEHVFAAGHQVDLSKPR